MAKGKGTVLSILVTVLLISLVACGSAGSQAGSSKRSSSGKESGAADFPVDDNGYPKKSVVLINGKEYSLTNIDQAIADTPKQQTMNLKVKKDQTSLKVVLPRISLIYFWSADPEESLSMTSYKKDSVEIKKEKILEGTSPELLTFEFELPPEDSDLTFQMANINDVEKAFSDQKAIYQLTIRITRSK
ncbi:MAG: hypothetical protein PUG16_01870 [Lachnospiraceae bacterium]|nr:hypothetical protein [Lachnospiraceae bacterium]